MTVFLPRDRRITPRLDFMETGMPTLPHRRSILAAGALSPALIAVPASANTQKRFKLSLNTSTIRIAEGNYGKARPIRESIAIAAKAGFAAIEPWISELEEFQKGGGSLRDLAKQIADAGLAVPNTIGFAEWLVDDPERRKKGLERAKKDMDLAKQIGAERIAAPPVGATGGQSRRDDPNHTNPVQDLRAAAERYAALLKIGKEAGITPVVEMWGFSKSLSRLGEVLLVAAECGLPGGCVLPDVYHLYKGGSDFAGLNLLGPKTIGIFHANDYPAIDRTKITDQDRVFPGDGTAPLKAIFDGLQAVGYSGYISLELFNHSYWKRDPHTVAKEGYEKLAAVA
jgi:2-keto-myo-inositol isomerase